MRKAFLSITAAVVILLAACGHADLSKVHVGDTTDQVIKAIGQPTEKKNLFMGISWWMYGKNSCVVVAEDKVTEVVPDMKAAMDSSKKAMDKLADPK